MLSEVCKCMSESGMKCSSILDEIRLFFMTMSLSEFATPEVEVEFELELQEEGF